MTRKQYELKRRTVYDIIERGDRTVRVISSHDRQSDAERILELLDPPTMTTVSTNAFK